MSIMTFRLNCGLIFSMTVCVEKIELIKMFLKLKVDEENYYILRE